MFLVVFFHYILLDWGALGILLCRSGWRWWVPHWCPVPVVKDNLRQRRQTDLLLLLHQDGQCSHVWTAKLGGQPPYWRPLYKPPLRKGIGDLHWWIFHSVITTNPVVSESCWGKIVQKIVLAWFIMSAATTVMSWENCWQEQLNTPLYMKHFLTNRESCWQLWPCRCELLSWEASKPIEA